MERIQLVIMDAATKLQATALESQLKRQMLTAKSRIIVAKQKKISGLTPVAADVHPELIHLTNKISRLYKLNNGKTSLYWNLVTVINQHIRQDSFNKLKK